MSIPHLSSSSLHPIWVSDESMRAEILELIKGLRFKPRACFHNTTKCVQSSPDRIQYVEGFLNDPCVIHSWCKFVGTDIFFDPTPLPSDRFNRMIIRVFDFEEYDRRYREHTYRGMVYYPLCSKNESYAAFLKYFSAKDKADFEEMWETFKSPKPRGHFGF